MQTSTEGLLAGNRGSKQTWWNGISIHSGEFDSSNFLSASAWMSASNSRLHCGDDDVLVLPSHRPFVHFEVFHVPGFACC